MTSTFKTQFEARQLVYFLLPHFISEWCEAEWALCTSTQHLPFYFWSYFIFYFINLSKHLWSRCSTYRLSKSVFFSFTEQSGGNKNFLLAALPRRLGPWVTDIRYFRGRARSLLLCILFLFWIKNPFFSLVKFWAMYFFLAPTPIITHRLYFSRVPPTCRHGALWMKHLEHIKKSICYF